MKAKLLKQLRKKAKKEVSLMISGDGLFVIKSTLGFYQHRLDKYYFSKKDFNLVYKENLDDAKKTLDDARRLFIVMQAKETKKQKKQKKYGQTYIHRFLLIRQR